MQRIDRVAALMINSLYDKYTPDIIKKRNGGWPIIKNKEIDIEQTDEKGTWFKPFRYNYVTCEEASEIFNSIPEDTRGNPEYYDELHKKLSEKK